MKTVEKIGKIANKNLHYFNKNNAKYFCSIFWQSDNEEYYAKVLASGFIFQEEIQKRSKNFMKNRSFVQDWTVTQHAFLTLITDEKLKEKFRHTFNLQ